MHAHEIAKQAWERALKRKRDGNVRDLVRLLADELEILEYAGQEQFEEMLDLAAIESGYKKEILLAMVEPVFCKSTPVT